MAALDIRAARAAGLALPDALTPGSEDARWQAGTEGEEGTRDGANCAAPTRAAAISLVVADVAELVRRLAMGVTA